MTTKHYILLFLVFGILRICLAQNPTVQDCLGAIPVCNQIYMETTSPSGNGNFPNEINFFSDCTRGENNSIWYVFTANDNGSLGFQITPNDLNDDYDWTLLDITNASCEDIYDNPGLVVSCNAAGDNGCHGVTGATGGSIYSIQGFGCNNSPPTINAGNNPFNAFVPMQMGNTYVLMINNWTGSPNGYTIDFGLSSGIGIFDETSPEIASISTPFRCNQDGITVVFSEFIQCSSINAANFELIGPGGPYNLSLSSFSCGNGGHHDRFFELTIDPPIASRGDFTLNLLSNQIDQVLDLCNNPAAPISWEFSVDSPITIDVSIGSDTTLLCDGNTLLLTTDLTNILHYSWSDNSTNSFLPVTTDGIYGVTVENVCGFGSDELEVIVQYEPPIIDLGTDQIRCPGEVVNLNATNELSTYVWQDGSTSPIYTVTQAGNYTVAVTNACGIASDEIAIDFIQGIDMELGPDVLLCEGDSLVLNVAHPDATSYEWQDGSTEFKRTIHHSGMYKIKVETPCETKMDSIQVTFIADNPIVPQKDTILCSGQSITYDYSVPGATYTWQDGDTNPIRTISQTGEYAITINTRCNIISDHIFVIVLDSIQTALGPDTFLCPGDRIILDASSGTRSNYQWMDGITNVTRKVTTPGTYAVHVSNHCEEVYDEIIVHECENCAVFIPNIFSPNDDGINDKIRPLSDCELLDYTFQIFDRWGNLLYQSNNPHEGWDGTFNGHAINSGIFVWQLSFSLIENNHKRNDRQTGSVAIIR